MSRFYFRGRISFLGLIMVCVLGVVSYLMPTAAYADPVHHFNHFLYTHINGDALYDDNSVNGNLDSGLAQQQYDNLAYPKTYIDSTQTTNAYNAYQAVTQHLSPDLPTYNGHQWQPLGPSTAHVDSQVSYTPTPNQATVTSGRITALAIDPNCNSSVCRVYVGAAGGGVWRTNDGLAAQPTWQYISGSIPSNAIGSLLIDPTDRSGRTIYVGTGEESGSSDSEAGVGLFKSTDYGNTWRLVPGSFSAANGRSIGAVAIDPSNPWHIYIGTDVARHGSSSVNGGRFTPPGAPTVGLYESVDGGHTFNLVFSKPSDTVNPTSPNGSDFFRGGVSDIQYYQHQVYFSMFDYGLYRSTAKGSFEQVFASPGGGTVANSISARTEFALAPMGQKLRIYVIDSGVVNDTTNGYSGDLYRVDNANVPASSLTDGTNNPGWTRLDSSQPGTPGYSSYDFCEGQCTYDMFVASPAGHPDEVWLGGSMNYNEIFTTTPPSNGRAVQRSVDGGVHFTDMTDDAEAPTLGMHPDQHAIVFDPRNPDIAFVGSDGGLVRTSGTFTDASSSCSTRGLSGADLTDCQSWLSAIPTRIFSLNAGLSTLQFQSVTYNPQNPGGDLIGGTQDNGTLSTTSVPGLWDETVGGDGGQSVIDVGNPNIRMHTYYGPSGDVNFSGSDPNDWNYWGDPLMNSGEAASFYVPLIGDPRISQTMFIGLGHIWRTQDSGGPVAYLRQYCNELTGQYSSAHPCGDWVPLGPNLITDPAFGTDKGGSYVVSIERAPSDTNTLWAATRGGRVFISTNANASDPKSVSFTRIDTSAQPNRFVSGIAVDPRDPFHAYVSFSGYNAYTPSTPGHVFDVHYNPQTGKATWKDISYDLGDQPITGIAYDSHTGSLYAATDFGVDRLRPWTRSWDPAAPGMPMVAVYGLTLSESGHVLYAATHGRGAWKLNLS